jgi:pantetheine-phosphate adenylyltransferase
MLNKDIGKGLESVFLITDAKYSYYSSTIVREILKGGKDVSMYLPGAVMNLIVK